MHHNVLLEIQNTRRILSVFSKRESSRVKCIKFSAVVHFFPAVTRNARVQTSTETNGISKRELLEPAAVLVAVH